MTTIFMNTNNHECLGSDLISLAAKKLAGIESEDVMAEGKDIEDVQVEHTYRGKTNLRKGCLRRERSFILYLFRCYLRCRG
jgi:hypothetical protein